MGFLFGNKSDIKKTTAEVINILSNGYYSFEINRRLYDIPEMRIAVNTVAETISTVPFYHVREESAAAGSEMQKVQYINNSPYRKVLSIRANKFQTSQTFFSNIVSRLLYNNDVFIMPEWDEVTGGAKALYPLPINGNFNFETIDGIDFVVFPSLGKAFIYSDIIHLQRFPDIKRGAKTHAIYTYTDVVQSMQQAAIKQLEASGKIKALLISRTGLKDRDMEKQLEEFKKRFLNAQNTTGLGMINGDFEVKPIEFNSQNLDTQMLSELTKRIYNYCGVSENIINKTATELEYQQFVNGLDSLLIQMAQAFTYCFFSENEIKNGNRITYDKLCLEIATMQAKSLLVDKMVYQGVITRNEARGRLGYGWIKDGDSLIANKNALSVKELNGNAD